MDDTLNPYQCLKSIYNIGSTSYSNICNGRIETVPWGLGNWLFYGLGFSFLLFFLLVFVSAFYKIVKGN